MKEHSTRMLIAAVALSALAALLASKAHARIPEGNTHASSASRPIIAEPVVIPYLSQGIGVDPSLFARPPRKPRLAPRALLRAGVPANANGLFIRPTQATSAYKRAAGMALHGDPEAQGFVSGRSDVNPFDAQ